MNDGALKSGERWPILHLFILVALAIAAGRIAVVKSPEGDTAFLSANDRSRWCTVATLVERGTYAIDEQIAITHPTKRNRRPWDSIDKVRHLGRDGEQHFYSSKPPLLATAVAGVYKLVQLCTGMTLTGQPIYAARIILALVNLPLLALFYYATIASVNRIVRQSWTSYAMAAACCFGTMVLPFAVTLNNHLPACAATAVVMWLYVRCAIRPDGTKEPGSDIAITFQSALWAGVCAALTVANELPALSMMVFWFLLFAWLDRAAILPYSFGVILVAAPFFGTNWIAHLSLKPPYMHRGNGAVIAQLDLTEATLTDDAALAVIRNALRPASLMDETGELQISPSDEAGRWIVLSGSRQYALLQVSGKWRLAHWDDWYEYPGTYWKDGNRRGVDRGEPSRLAYLFHLTFGHHGLFSLTPLWLLMPVGLVVGLGREPAAMKRFFAAVLVATSVCFLFYLSRPLIDRNYGGVSVCFRWLLWFAPLWLVSIAGLIDTWPGDRPDDRPGARLWRAAISLLLASSVFSVAASLSTPWQSPWLYQFWRFLGWIVD